MVRLFLGLELPEHIKRQALALRCHWPGARWQSAAQLHLTLARFGRRPTSAEPFLRDHADFRSSPFQADAVCLFASHLSPEGARYEPIRRVRFD